MCLFLYTTEIWDVSTAETSARPFLLIISRATLVLREMVHMATGVVLVQSSGLSALVLQ